MSRDSSRPYDTGPGTPTNAEHPVVRLLDNRLAPHEISPSGELFRAFDRYSRRRASLDRSVAGLPAGGQANSSLSGLDVEDDPHRLGEEQVELHESVNFLDQTPEATADSASHAINSRHPRPRITERSRHLDRHRSLPDNRAQDMTSNGNAGMSGIAELHHAGQRLETASQQMRALLDDSQSILAQSSITAAEYAGEAETNRAFKRRKIDHGVINSGFPGPSYGHYGQVEPGKLRMEIEFCDGGTFLEGFPPGSTAYSAGNVLKNDDSVYCTKGNRCNLVLRHQGSTPFSLTELMIKGPPRDYTDPVQEGMVFVSMEADDLLNRTAQYQIQYSAPRNSSLRRRANRDPNNDGIISIRHNVDGTTGVDEDRRQHLHATVCEEHDYRLAQIPADFFIDNAPPFNVTTECFDSDSEGDDSPPARRRRGHGSISDRLSAFLSGIREMTDEPSSEEDRLWQDHLRNMGEGLVAAAASTAQLRPRLEDDPAQSFPQRPRSVVTPSYNPPRTSALASAINAAQEATAEAVKAVGGTPIACGSTRSKENALMAPLAWFFIETDKSKCAIKFDPPVSGRFILLKMWSPHHTPAGNIDIQSVVAKGFVGPRFFPAGKMR